MKNRKSKIYLKTNLLLISLFCLFWLFRSQCNAQQARLSETVGQNYLRWVDCEKYPKKHLKKPIKFEIKIENIYTDLQSGYCLGFDGILMEDYGSNEQHKISTHFHPWNQFFVNGEKMTFNDATSNEGMKPGAIVVVEGKFKGIDKNGAVVTCPRSLYQFLSHTISPIC